MPSRTVGFVAATIFFFALTIGSSIGEESVQRSPIKLDKNLRKALLKALTDLDAESAEQKSKTEEERSEKMEPSSSDENSSNYEEIGQPIRTIFSFDGFPSDDDETPSEDKLQNSTFVEMDKYETSDDPKLKPVIEKSIDETSSNKAFQAHDVILPDKSSAIYDKSPEIVYDQLETRSVKTLTSPINVIANSDEKGQKSFQETLTGSSSNGIATANGLVEPSPTVSSPIVKIDGKNDTKEASSSSTSGNPETAKTSKEEQEVKIFQAPLVAAFTVQQDERGVPKSIVPIYHPTGNGQALTLQEQLDFKQRLLEKQLAELQAQQLQQTQFLVRQRQIYEQQLRQKQQQELYIQEQTRLKQFQEEQARLKQFQDQRNQYQSQGQNQQTNFPSQLQQPLQQQSFKNSNVNVQPSLTLELPKSGIPQTFQSIPFQSNSDQLRIQRLRQQQLQLQQQQLHQQRHQQQLIQQQQRLQQSFPNYPIDFQSAATPAATPASRFNRQEAFGTTGNFGFNDNRQQQLPNLRNHFSFNQQSSRGPQTFSYNPYPNQQLQQQQQQQFRARGQQTPAKQIQNLLYQSGLVSDIGNVQGTGGQEDLNILSKVLALNVGAIPNKNRYNNYSTGNNNA